MKVITNTSPLLLLAKIGRLDLLGQLFKEALVARAVYEEIKAKPGRETQEIETLLQTKVLHLQEARIDIVRNLPVDLGKGERETIALAIGINADLVVMDDQEGRRLARARGLPVTGTIGILIEARERKLIASIQQEMDRLIEAGMWLDEVFYHRILQEFDE